MRKLAFVLLPILALGGLLAWYNFSSESAEELLARATAAIEAGEAIEAKRLAGLLAQSGHEDAAQLVQARILLQDGRERQKKSRDAARMDIALGRIQIFGYSCGFHASRLPSIMSASRLAFFQPNLNQDRHWFQLGRDYSRQARSFAQDAIIQLGQIPLESPVKPEADELAGITFARLGRPQQAATILSNVVRKRPNSLDAHRWLAIIHFDLGSMHSALDHLKIVTELDPGEGGPFRMMGHIYKDYGQIGDAIEWYQKALNKNLTRSEKANVVRQLSELLVREGKYEEAIGVMDQCPPGWDDDPDYRIFRAQCDFYGKQHHERALSVLKAILTESPNSVPASRLLARFSIDLGRPSDAVPLLRNALTIEPYDDESAELLARSYSMMGNSKAATEARAVVKTAQEVKTLLTDLNNEAMSKPWDVPLRIRIAETWLKISKRAEAMMWLETALSIEPDNRHAAELLTQIRNGQR